MPEKPVEREQHKRIAEKESRISRRTFIETVSAASVAALAAGFGIGKAFENTGKKDLSEVNPAITPDDPVEIQIRRFENANQLKGLENEDFRNKYTWLLAQWYAQFTFGAFADPNDPYATAEKIYNSTFYITDQQDEQLKGNEDKAGWSSSYEDIFINLTHPQFHKQEVNVQASVIAPIILLRDTLTHEMTHFITAKKKEAKSLRFFGEKLKKKFAYLNGFRLYLEDDNADRAELADFDESVTELIANNYQRISGFSIGLPFYPDVTKSENQKPKVEKIIDTLDATLKFAGISVDQLALFHANSDLDGLALSFASTTTKVFKDDEEKLSYGLSVIEALRTADTKTLGKYIEEVKK